jgi:hypothetical protein
LCWTVVSLVSARTSAAANSQIAVKIEGAGGDDIRAQIISALGEGIDVTDPTELAAELSQRKLDDLAGFLADTSRRPVLIKKLHHAERTLALDAIVVGSVVEGEHKGALALQLVVVLPKQAETTIDETTLLNKKGEIAGHHLRSLSDTILGAMRDAAAAAAKEATPAAAEGEQAATEAKPEAEPAEVGPLTPTDARLVAYAGLDLASRQFHYNQRITNANLRPYDLPGSALFPAAPGGALSIEYYPLAQTSTAGARDVGVTGHLGYNFAKAAVGNVTLDTTWYTWDLNVRGRYNLGPRGTSPLVGVEGGIGQLVFTFKDNNTGLADIVPGVNYLYLRLGADGRLPLGKLALTAGAAYRHLLKDGGTLGKHFPRADISGLDARVGAAFAIANNLEARLTLVYVRYWEEFNSIPSDTYIAGGAVDHMLSADLGVAAFF